MIFQEVIFSAFLSICLKLGGICDVLAELCLANL